MRLLSGYAFASRAAVPRAFLSTYPSHTGRTVAFRRLYSVDSVSNIATRPQISLQSSSFRESPLPFLSSLARQQVLLSSDIPATRRWISFKDLKASSQSAQGARDAQKKKDKAASAEEAPKAEETAAKFEAAAEEPVAERGQTYEEWKRAQRAQGASDNVEEPAPEEEKAQEKPEGEAEAEGEAGKEEAADGKGKKEKPPPPPPHGDKTPWQVFTETLTSEFKKNKDWTESTKALSGSVHDFTQNENVQRLTRAYQKGSDTAGSATSAALKGTASAIGKGAAWTWDTPVVKGIRTSANVVGSGLEKATRPVRETEAFKNVKNVIDDGSSSRYGGWVEKEERRKRREALAARKAASGETPLEKMEEDPNAGTNVTLHKDSQWQETWRNFKDNSRMVQGLFSMNRAYQESDNPFISTARGIADRFAGFFAENETAMVIKKFREIDPNFKLEPFLTEMRDWILPEVLDAYVKGDIETLKLWLSTPQYQVYEALMRQYTTAGLKSDGRILDIRHVDILNARLLDPGEIPVFIITCRTQEVHVYRNKKSNELAAGMEDKVQQVTYAIGVTRIPEDVNNPETRGWRLIELQKSAREYI